MTDKDTEFMTYALSLAERGKLWTSPNPMVGAVITSNNKIIGEGFHEKYGREHAEVNAFKGLGDNLEGATLYVTLEPCSIHGKTPPCTDAILSSGIRRVVIAMKDPNPQINGAGIRILEEKGIKVDIGLLEEKASRLNEKYVKYASTSVPWVTLKAAQTLDGRIADMNGDSKWITGESSRKTVHSLRATHDALLVGAGTVIKDDPVLNVRNVEGKNPVRVIIDEDLAADLSSKVYQVKTDASTILFTAAKNGREKIDILTESGVKVITYENSDGLDISWMLRELGSLGISSLLVEGGSRIFSSFLSSDSVDRYIFFINPSLMGNGLDTFKSDGFKVSKRLQLKEQSIELVGEDFMIQGVPVRGD
ncbi:bifunctional diaminohydroxyphosphoribosylaminopyrimidine deaminase/5-amino-6-(5-phosphoribosylamino)uracil reductase RibD [Candidatus Marinimicrobia bacterium MT.SAG.4]|nr:bifunctional diaminohydroxyphosphoribosylaminopyrimidine deaminase/5-amino-6-(5-phosphoribosylamino)uracil reductase RibD [Candidatus Marinimicrobia bacterium MT.SAG.4]